MLLHAIDAALLDALAAILLYLWHRHKSINVVPTPIDPPNPPPGPIPMPTTIGDLINADETAFSDQASKADAAAKADADLANANMTLTTADGALAGGLSKVGPAFTIDTNGSVIVYFSDSSSKGFHKITPVPVTATLPDPPAPVVDPIPSPVAPIADITPGV